MTKKRVMIAQMNPINSKEAQEFDKTFWLNAGPERRFAAAWEMVQEVSFFRGEKDAGQSRLQRSVCVLQRREG